jgi:hypothetical protein
MESAFSGGVLEEWTFLNGEGTHCKERHPRLCTQLCHPCTERKRRKRQEKLQMGQDLQHMKEATVSQGYEGEAGRAEFSL